MTTTRTPTKERILDSAHALVTEHGFGGTSIDSILSNADASKGAFFHHFASKEALGEALLDRYAQSEAQLLAEIMSRAEAETDDPAEQLVAFVRMFEGIADDISETSPSCLFVSFIYERGPGGARSGAIIQESIELWRDTMLAKLEGAAESRPELAEMDLPAIADQVFTVFEGGFILARATDDPSHLRRQIAQFGNYLALLLDVDERSSPQ